MLYSIVIICHPFSEDFSTIFRVNYYIIVLSKTGLTKLKISLIKEITMKKEFTLFFVFIFSILFNVACNNTRQAESHEGYKTGSNNWSIIIADAAMQRYDSLIHYLDNPAPKWSYDIAMLGLAIDKLGSYDEKYSQYMQDYIDYFVNEEGDIKTYSLTKYRLDDINPGKNLIVLYKRTGEEKYLKAIDTLIKQLRGQPRTHSGGFWHKEVYPWQMWLDGIYMASPFMAQYAKEFNHPLWFDTVVQQITLIHEKTLDSQTGLLYHAWDESKQQKWANPETGCSPNFWGRAMGWYMMALVDVLDYLPDSHPGHDKIVNILQETADALMKVRDDSSGLWFQVLDQGNREGNYIEISASAMFTYAFAKGANRGYLPDRYHQIADESFNSIINHYVYTDKDSLPSITNICAAAGLGGSPYRDGSYDYYINERRQDNDPKGVAPFIMAAIELGY